MPDVKPRQPKGRSGRKYGPKPRYRRAAWRKQFLDIITLGNFLETACEAMRVGQYEWAEWAWQAEQGDPFALAFMEDIKQAEAGVEIQLVGMVIKEAELDPKIALEYLKLRNGARWNNRASQDAKFKVPEQAAKLETDEGLDAAAKKFEELDGRGNGKVKSSRAGLRSESAQVSVSSPHKTDKPGTPEGSDGSDEAIASDASAEARKIISDLPLLSGLVPRDVSG